MNDKAATILVAEDLVTNQKIIYEILQMLLCDVDIVSNGQEAFERFSSRRYDLIFMDCQMPVLDGYTATIKIREHEKRQRAQSCAYNSAYCRNYTRGSQSLHCGWNDRPFDQTFYHI